ncbi:LamG-like jellyroll fold domain-containing protein, partial [Phaeodactylibacter xiamenensis]|uniref:LamG-like jellyroll fold domain-containing protein n=1 Tax=Phaeodactylibacter xiamenensis TaxID=1524460 RepID=UPI0005C5D20E
MHKLDQSKKNAWLRRIIWHPSGGGKRLISPLGKATLFLKEVTLLALLLLLGTTAGNNLFGQISMPEPDDGPGNALHFDGSDDRVIVPAGVYFDDNTFTIETWMNPHGLRGWSRILDFEESGVGNRVVIYTSQGDTRRVYVEVFNGGAKIIEFGAEDAWEEDHWVHVAFVVADTVASLYLNGELSALRRFTGSVPAAMRDLNYIGACSGGYCEAPVVFDEFRIWSDSRTEEEIRSYMYSELDTSGLTDLVLYYQFNQDNGTLIPDLSGNGRDGTVDRFALTGTTSNWVESYAMAIPKNTAATSIMDNEFTAEWSPIDNGIAEQYIIDVSTSYDFRSGTFVPGYESLSVGLDTMAVITGLDPNTSYFWRVRADKSSVAGQGAFTQTQITFTEENMSSPGFALDFESSSTKPYNNIVVGDGVYFDGNSLTIEAMVYLDSFSNLNPLMEFGSAAYNESASIFLNDGGSSSFQGWPIFYLYDRTDRILRLISNEKLPLKKWTHFAVVVDGSMAYMYIDGKEVGSSSVTGDFKSVIRTSNLIGGSKGGGDSPDIILDEFRVWSRPLSQDELIANSSTELNLPVQDLELYYRFSRDKGEGVKDYSGNGRHGVLKDFSFSGTTSNWVRSYALERPFNLSTTNIGASNFTANWTPPNGLEVDRYLLDVSDVISFSTFVSGFEGRDVGNVTSFDVAGLNRGANYYWRGRALNDTIAGPGQNSLVDTVTALRTGIISAGHYAPGDTVLIPYSSSLDIAYSATNSIEAQISDSSGSFSTPITIGSVVTSDLIGVVEGIIPIDATPGTKYRIRVVSTAPEVIGTDNFFDITISDADQDGDGVIDFKDGDRDNDGLSNLVEVGEIFTFTGRDSVVTIPDGAVGMRVKVWGAGGANEVGGPQTAGAGGYTYAEFGSDVVVPGQQLSIMVGEGGNRLYDFFDHPGSQDGAYGFGGSGNHDGGGGLSGVFTGNAAVLSTDQNRALVVAGGGGGGDWSGFPNEWASGTNGNGLRSGGISGSMKGSNDQDIPCRNYYSAGGGGYYGGSRTRYNVGPNFSCNPDLASGRGGAGFVSPMAKFGSIEATPDGNRFPPNINDPFYIQDVGVGATTATRIGGNGLIIIFWEIDLDDDGLSNDMDNDSDADGCPDVVEGYGSFTFDLDNDGYYGVDSALQVNTSGMVLGALYPELDTNVVSAGTASSFDSQPVDLDFTNSSDYKIGATVSPGSGTPIYQWEYSTDDGNVWKDVVNDTLFNGFTGSQLDTLSFDTIPPGILLRASYRLRVTSDDFSCPIFSNAVTLNIDRDGDGIDDALEDEGQTDPLNPCDPAQDLGYTGYDADNAIWAAGDCDGDGLINSLEHEMGTDPYNVDTDGDGIEDGSEDGDNTDPLD